MMEYWTLRQANDARQAEWHAASLPLTFRTNELAGECGEVSELIIDRWTARSRFEHEWRAKLADEMSDVIICSDLVAWSIYEPLDLARIEGSANPHVGNDYMWCTKLLRDVGLLCNIAKKVDRHKYGIAGGKSLSPTELMQAVDKVAQRIFDLAYHEGINMEVAIARKFNATSAKVGLTTLLVPPGHDRAILIP